MGPYATFASGILVGLIVFLAMAVTGVVAVNGVNNPGIGAAQASAAAGGTNGGNGERDPSSLSSLDLNGDGKLSLAEAAGHPQIVTRFDRADRNKDGKLTEREFERLAKLPEPKAGKKKPAAKQARRPEASAAAGG